MRGTAAPVFPCSLTLAPRSQWNQWRSVALSGAQWRSVALSGKTARFRGRTPIDCQSHTNDFSEGDVTLLRLHPAERMVDGRIPCELLEQCVERCCLPVRQLESC